MIIVSLFPIFIILFGPLIIKVYQRCMIWRQMLMETIILLLI